MFARIIRDPASPTEKVSVFFLKLFFFASKKKCIASFTMNTAKVYSLRERLVTPQRRGEGRGERSSLAFKET